MVTEIDTAAQEAPESGADVHLAGATLTVAARSVVVLGCPLAEGD